MEFLLETYLDLQPFTWGYSGQAYGRISLGSKSIPLSPRQALMVRSS